MKFKTFLKYGLPILGATALSISLPLILTSCSDNETSKPIKLSPSSESNNIQVGANDFESQKLSVEVPNEWKDNSNITYSWEYRQVESSASLVKTSSDEWKSLNIETKEPNLIVNPVFLYNGSVFDKEFRCVAKEGNNELGISSEMKFTASEDFEHANVVNTSIDNINKLVNESSSIFNSTWLNQFKEYPDGALILKFTSSQKTKAKTLLEEVAPILEIEANELEDITLTLSNGWFNNEETVTLDAVVTLKTTVSSNNVDPASSYTWGSSLYLNSNNSNYSFNNKNELVLKGIKTSLKVSDIQRTEHNISEFSSKNITDLENKTKNWTSDTSVAIGDVYEITRNGTSKAFNDIMSAFNSTSSWLDNGFSSIYVKVVGEKDNKALINIEINLKSKQKLSQDTTIKGNGQLSNSELITNTKANSTTITNLSTNLNIAK